jgi:hypothetical protein
VIQRGRSIKISSNNWGWTWLFLPFLILVMAHGEEAHTKLKPGVDKASWMSCFHQPASTLNQLTLREICLPGTHDSGAFQVLSAREKVASPWVITQQLNLLDQLKAGARRLDLRVMKVSQENKKNELQPGFYLHHGGYATVSLDEALRQIKTYLDSNSARTETVLLEFSHFRGFQRGQKAGSDYAAFLSLLKKSIGPRLLQRNPRGKSLVNLPLKDLKGKAVLLVATGSFFEGEPQTPLVHRMHGGRPIYDRFSNRDRTSEMIADQAKKFRAFNSNDHLFLLNWTLTPRPSLRSLGGVRKLAVEANAQLLKQFKNPEQPFGRPNQSGRIVNVINVDFYGGKDCQVLASCFEVMRNPAVRE